MAGLHDFESVISQLHASQPAGRVQPSPGPGVDRDRVLATTAEIHRSRYKRCYVCPGVSLFVIDKSQ